MSAWADSGVSFQEVSWERRIQTNNRVSENRKSDKKASDRTKTSSSRGKPKSNPIQVDAASRNGRASAMSNAPKTAKSRSASALYDEPRPDFGAGVPLDCLSAAIKECEAVLALGPLPDSIGHGDAFGHLLRLLRELGPPESIERYLALTQRHQFA